MNKSRKPSWWLLNSLIIGMISALFFTQRFMLSARPVSQIGIVFVGYWLVWRWLSSNAPALEEDERRKRKDDENLPKQVENARIEQKPLTPQQVHYFEAVKVKRQ